MSSSGFDSARLGRALGVAALVAVLNVIGWMVAHPTAPAPDAVGPRPVAGLAYSPFGRHDDPLHGRGPSAEHIRADLNLLKGATPSLRLYSASEWPHLSSDVVAAGLRVTPGVWLGEDKARNRRELDAIVQAHRRSPAAVERVIVGNETQLHKSVPRKELVAALSELRRTLRVPVSTAEPWHVWLSDPALVRQVDFITVHLLPYWEGVPHAGAVDYALMRLNELRKRFPGKPIVIGEFGWPSAGEPIAPSDAMPGGLAPKPRALTGDPRAEAHATPQTQAQVLREFVARVPREAPGTEYFLIEAFDQPWKRGPEGAAGPYWGVFDAARQAKFDFTGAVPANPWWPRKAAIATAAGALAAVLLALALPRLRLGALAAVAVGAQALLSLAVAVAAWPLAHYLPAGAWFAWFGFAVVLALLAALLLAQAFEFAELYWPHQLRRSHGDRPWCSERAGRAAPGVSVHLACCNEPPEMVIATIESLRALDLPPLEVLVIDNNTQDPALWRPVQDHIERINATASTHSGTGPRLRFFQLSDWPGYKAGALNFALRHTDPRAEVVAVVDADYVVRPDWLRRLLGHFEQRDVAVVQSPQAHRQWQHDFWRRCMNWEYEGFFRIGMHHRHERDAIIQHGTVTLIRASALREAGGWDERCICEDTELGLRLFERGWRAVYVDRVAGRGLMPDDFGAYKSQRRRWAEGAMQIFKSHARTLLWPGLAGTGPRGRLSAGQRYHFIAGWLPWWADTLHLLFTVGAVAWSAAAVLWPQHVSLPDPIYLLPALALPLLRLVTTPLLYRRRVGCGAADTAGAMLAGMALSHSAARGVMAGLLGRRTRFVVTRKGGDAPERKPPAWPVREEAALLIALAGSALAVSMQPALQPAAAGPWWLLLLLVQGLPYAAAMACQTLATRAERAPQPIAASQQPVWAPPEE